MVNLNKKGIVVLTHYRSGGTQFVKILIEYLEALKIDYVNLSELNFNDDYNFDATLNYKQYVDSIFLDNSDKFKIIHLNNHLVITYLMSIDYFPKLIDLYDVHCIERKNTINALTSLSLWEEFIGRGYYSFNHYPPEIMHEFHNYLLENPIPASYLHTGIDYGMSINNKRNYIDFQVSIYNSKVHSNRYLSSKYNIPIFYYEDYEYNQEYFKNKLDSSKLSQEDQKTFFHRIDNTYKKIPYIYSDYSLYYEPIVQEVLKYWYEK